MEVDKLDTDAGEEGEECRPRATTDNATVQILKRSRQGGFGVEPERRMLLLEANVLGPTRATLPVGSGSGPGEPPCKRVRLLTPEELVVGPEERTVSSLTAEALPSIQAKQVRALGKQPSWDDIITAGRSVPSSKLPPQLIALFKECNESRSLGTEPWSCPSLTFFELQWHEELGCLVCWQHNRLVPGNYVWRHLSISHPGRYAGTTRATVFNAALCHIVGCHPGIKHQSSADVKNSLPAHLEAPISMQSCDVAMRYKCPAPGCPQWTHQNKSRGAPEAEHKRHLKTHSLSEIDPCSQYLVIPEWTQRVDLGAGRSKSHGPTGDTHCFTVPPPALPPLVLEAPFTSADDVAPSTQNWAESLGWEDHVATLARQAGGRMKVVAKLRDLVALPSKERVRKSTNEVTQVLEKGLLLSNYLNLTYMRDGAEWVASKHTSIRARFSHNP